MIYIFILAISVSSAFAYECSIQTEFYRSLPVFLGTTGTLEISTEKVLVLSNRGTGILTEKKANTTRYSYPAERIEAHIIQTKEDNGDVVVTTAPKYFNCNVRQAVLRDNRIVALSYCSVDGCRHLTPEVCAVLKDQFSEERIRLGKNPLALTFEVESRIKAMTKELHQENSLLMRNYRTLESHSKRVLGVSMSEFETEEGTTATFGLLKIGGILASETEYCKSLERNGLFWKEDQRPSKFLKKAP
jgi:hypothetical protein